LSRRFPTKKLALSGQPTTQWQWKKPEQSRGLHFQRSKSFGLLNLIRSSKLRAHINMVGQTVCYATHLLHYSGCPTLARKTSSNCFEPTFWQCKSSCRY